MWAMLFHRLLRALCRSRCRLCRLACPVSCLSADIIMSLPLGHVTGPRNFIFHVTEPRPTESPVTPSCPTIAPLLDRVYVDTMFYPSPLDIHFQLPVSPNGRFHLPLGPSFFLFVLALASRLYELYELRVLCLVQLLGPLLARRLYPACPMGNR